MRLGSKLFAGVVTAALISAGTFVVSAQAGDKYGSPAASGRTVWEGTHLGGHVGAIDSDFGISQPTPALVTISEDDDGMVGGLVYGGSWQFGNFVVGTDSALNFGGQKTGLSLTGMGSSATAKYDWNSESKLRAGLLVNPGLLIYGTVGIAAAEVKVAGTIIAGGKNDERVFGVAYGGGAEMNFGSRWFARVEYVHTDYDQEKFANAGGSTFNVDLDTDVVRGAIGYRFDWSPLDLLSSR